MYYPMLRFKKGEKDAMSNAPRDWFDRVSPVWMFEERSDYLTEYNGIKAVWFGSFILDVSSDDISAFNHELYQILQDPLARIAITYKQLSDMNPPLLDAFMKKPVLKITIESIEQAMNDIWHLYNVNQISLSGLKDITLILDFCEVGQDYIDNAQKIASHCDFYNISKVTSIIVSSGVFPKMLDGVLGRHTIDRLDKKFYDQLVYWSSNKFLYSDYATIHPWWRQKDTLRSGHTNLRYTHDNYWLVLRAHGKGSPVSAALAKLLVSYPEYRGAGFSWADGVWNNRSLLPPPVTRGGGNQTNHVSEFIHHHIAQVLAFG